MVVSSEENKLIEQLAKFEGLKELLEDDIEEDTPHQSVFTNVADNHPPFKELYLELRVAHQRYKNRFVPATVSETDFNATGSPCRYNDPWFLSVKKEFQRVNRAVVAFLESKSNSNGAAASNSGEEQKIVVAAKAEVERVISKVRLESKQVTQSIDETFKKLHSHTSINPNQSQIYSNLQQHLVAVIDDKIPSLLATLYSVASSAEQAEVEDVRKEFASFEDQEKTRLYQLVQVIAEKTSFAQAGSSSRQDGVGHVKGGAVHLKKMEAPKFSGEETDFPEFHRKWLAVVAPANLPEEAEVDRLRDALPKEAKDMLTGVNKIAKAWDILTKRFGDKDLIATKLKNELKGLSISSKTDHEKIITLVIKIRSLVSRLESLGASEALKYDGEFVSSIYFQLPDRHRNDWLKLDKSAFPDKWSAVLDFLDSAYERAVQEKLLLASYTPASAKKSGGGSAAGFCAAKVEEESDSGNGASAEANNREREKQKTRLENAKKRVGKCPVCGKEHTFKSQWSTTPWPSDRFLMCQKFGDMSKKQRAEALKRAGGCIRCTAWGHQKSDCKLDLVDCKETVNGSRCHKDHSKLVCDSGVAYCLAAKSITDQESTAIDVFEETLHYVQDIIVNKGDEARSIWDNGSNRALVNNTFAEENNLKSRKATVTMNVVGEVKKVETKIYELDLQDMYGRQHSIWGYGIDNIIDPDDPVDLQPVRHLFPHVPEQAFIPLPKKRIDILIGLNYNALHPSGGLGVDSVGNLKALRSIFGSGWVIGGCHKSLKSSPLRFSTQAAAARLARVTVIPDIEVKEPFDSLLDVPGCTIAKLSVDPILTPDFWESESLGVLPPRKCPKCKQCAEKGACSEAHLLLTMKEEAELKLISDNIDVVDGEVHVKYPFIKDPSCLQNNRIVAVKVAGRLWSSLQRDGLLNAYHEEMRKYIDRGTFVKLSQEELTTYEGPNQYITHHGVLKDSVSTPLRVVTNSSFNNGGHSLNSCLPKGPNSLNDMLVITLRFRGYEIVFMFDLSKAYNTMRTGIVEKHLRRFVWRFSENEEWQDYGIDRVHFGDRSAACQLEVSKNKVAELGRHIDSEAADRIIHDTYVDDGPSGGNLETVQRMVGVKDENGDYNGTISQILAIGNYKVKEFVVSGDLEQEDENLLGNKVFGYDWNPKTDIMGIKFSINLSRKKRNVRIKPDLTSEDIDSLKSITMTKRLLLGVTNSFGDFLGMASPFTIKLKLNMKKIFEQDSPLGWDEDIPAGLRESWIQLIVEALLAGGLSFPRSTRPHDVVGGPMVVGFGDGAFAAYAAAVYLVWRLPCDHGEECQGHFSSSLLVAKCRVTPLRGFTVPRSELSGGLLVSRLVLTAVLALSRLDEKPTSSVILLDSTCTISSLEENARKLKPFFHNRRGEMLENMDKVREVCSMEEVHHVSGKLNPADVATRANTKIEDIGPGSFWQTGPTFLCTPREHWPVTRDFVRVDIPDDEKRHSVPMATAEFRALVVRKGSVSDCLAAMPALHVRIHEILQQNNNLESRKRVLAWVVRGWSHGKESVALSSSPDAEELKNAERLILSHGMFETSDAYLKGTLASLLPERQGALIVTRGRLGERSLERLLGVSALPILMPNTRVAELFMWRAHVGYSNLFHRSVAQTLAHSRNSVWVVKGKDLAKRVYWQCMQCARIRKELASQQMALIREESLTPCPPWTYVSLDFAGPVVIKGEVNTRSRGKSWILLYVCRSTKAVCLLATSGYSTADFLCKHEEYVSRKGKPKKIVSDRGSQLVRAGMVLAEKERPANWKWQDVVKKNSTTSWEFVPIGSQHRNGLSESQVKILKKCLHLAITPGTVLKYSELVTLLAKIAFSINSRPLGLQSTSQNSQQEDFLSPITPNQLILGRSDDDAPPLDYTEDDKLTARLAYVSGVFSSWWSAWYQQVLPTLVPCRKWRKEVRNLEVGDVVFMYYPSSIKDEYRLARVTETFPDEKSLVRTVRVCYRKKDKREQGTTYRAKPLTEELVAVQRLSVLLPVSEQTPSPSLSTTTVSPLPLSPELPSSSTPPAPTSSPPNIASSSPASTAE